LLGWDPASRDPQGQDLENDRIQCQVLGNDRIATAQPRHSQMTSAMPLPLPTDPEGQVAVVADEETR
jgi:hypothetical protein